MTSEMEELYWHVTSPGDPIPMGDPPFHFSVDDSILEDEDIVWEVRRLWLNRSGVPSVIREEHLRQWLIAATRDDSPDVTDWMKVVAIVKSAFQDETLSE